MRDDYDSKEFLRGIKIAQEITTMGLRGLFTISFAIEEKYENHRWRRELPFISWPVEWEVKYYPSMSALLRGIVRLKSDHSRRVSFYFDGYCNLGAMYDFGNDGSPMPYWEIFNVSDPLLPSEDAGPQRVLMYEIDAFLKS